MYQKLVWSCFANSSVTKIAISRMERNAMIIHICPYVGLWNNPLRNQIKMHYQLLGSRVSVTYWCELISYSIESSWVVEFHWLVTVVTQGLARLNSKIFVKLSKVIFGSLRINIVIKEAVIPVVCVIKVCALGSNNWKLGHLVEIFRIF